MANQNPLATNLTLEQQKNLFGNAYLNMLWHCPTALTIDYTTAAVAAARGGVQLTEEGMAAVCALLL